MSLLRALTLCEIELTKCTRLSLARTYDTMAYKGHAANIKETTQIKKKPHKQKRKHANNKENTQTKKKTRK